MSLLDLGLVILAAIAILPIISYTVSRFYYRPKIVLEVGGQQSGYPIPLPSQRDLIYLSVATEKSKKVLIKEVLVESKSNDVDELASKEAKRTITLDKEFTTALHFSGSWLITKKYAKLFVFSYKAKEGIVQFPLKIIVYAKVDESEVRFPWDMMSPKIHKHESVLQFKVEDFKGDLGEKLKRYGARLGPRETVMAGDTIERKSS